MTLTSYENFCFSVCLVRIDVSIIFMYNTVHNYISCLVFTKLERILQSSRFNWNYITQNLKRPSKRTITRLFNKITEFTTYNGATYRRNSTENFAPVCWLLLLHGLRLLGYCVGAPVRFRVVCSGVNGTVCIILQRDISHRQPTS